MDPVTALGLVSNVIQFVEYAAKLISGCHDLYRSANGALDDHNALETVSQNLKSLAQDVQPSKRSPNAKQSRVEEELQLACEECIKVNQKILELLEKLKVNGPNRKWESFRQILNIMMRQKDVARLEEDLKKIQQRIDTSMLFCLRWVGACSQFKNPSHS